MNHKHPLQSEMEEINYRQGWKGEHEETMGGNESKKRRREPTADEYESSYQSC